MLVLEKTLGHGVIPPDSTRNLGKEIPGATLGKKHKRSSPVTPELMPMVPHSHYPTTDVDRQEFDLSRPFWSW